MENSMAEKQDAAALAAAIAQKTEVSATTSPTPAGQTDPTAPPDSQLIEAINQVFALFRLNYHNQYYAAWSDAEQVKQVKRLWLEALDAYPTAVILRAAQHAIEHSDYLPTLNRMIEACRHCLSDLGLPSPYDAYRQACLAPSPKTDAAWQHPAVYLAGRDSDWFFLANEQSQKRGPSIESTTSDGSAAPLAERCWKARSGSRYQHPQKKHPAQKSKSRISRG
jgi:hypothetical protein